MKGLEKGARFGLVCSVSLAETIGLLIALFVTPLMRLFVDDPQVIQYGVERAHYATILFFMLAYSHGVSAVSFFVFFFCFVCFGVFFLNLKSIQIFNFIFFFLFFFFFFFFNIVFFFFF